MKSTMRLILIRHAEARHNFKPGFIAGPRSCTGLTERGYQQARLLSSRIRNDAQFQNCQIILSSPALRALQTAQTLLPSLPGAALISDEHLYEQLPGKADGMSIEDYATAYGKFDRASEPDRPMAPGGESWNQFLRRVQETPWRIAETYPDQTVVAVTHAGFIVISFLALFGIPPQTNRAWIDPDFTGITEWEMNARPALRLLRYNDSAHLSCQLDLWESP